MTPAVGVAVLVWGGLSIAVDHRWGHAAGATACGVLGMLLIPPTFFYGPVLVWRDLLVAAGLLVVVGLQWWKDSTPVALRGLDLVVALLVLLPLIGAVGRRGAVGPTVLLEVVEQGARWGVPYLAGRLLLRKGDALRIAAAVVVVATAAYAPVCLIDSLTRPALADRLFGIQGPTVGATSMLLNFWGPQGYRPYGFTYSFFELVLIQVAGLALAVGLWLTPPEGEGRRWWRTVAVVGGVVNALALILLSRSWAGILLPIGTLGLFGLMLLTRMRLWLLLACLVVPVYVGLRATEIIPTSPLPFRNADGAEFLAGRGRSINARTSDERQVLDAVSENPLFGTGAQYRGEDGGYRIASKYNIDGGVFTRLLRHGYVGLACLLLMVLGPAVLTVIAMPTAEWRLGLAPLMLAAATVLVALAINLVPNHASAALYPLLGGGLVSLTGSRAASAEPISHPACASS